MCVPGIVLAHLILATTLCFQVEVSLWLSNFLDEET